MAKVSKEKSERSATFAEGGDTHMFGQQAAGSQKSGTTRHDTKGDGGEFAKGGAGKMFGFAGSQSAKAGITSAR